MPARRRALCVATTLSFALADCGRSPITPSTLTLPSPPSPPSIHFEVDDIVGDAQADSQVPIPADFVRATVDVVAPNVTIGVRFVPGTFNQQTMAIANLDTDRNALTGRPSFGLGWEYQVIMDPSNGRATITGGDPVTQQVVPLQVAVASMQVSMPLALVSSTDGRFCFRLHAGAPLERLHWPEHDVIPDSNVPPACTQ